MKLKAEDYKIMKKKRYQLSFLVRWAGELGCVLALTLFVLGRMALAQGIYEDDVREATDIKDIEEEFFGVEDQGFILQDQYQHTPTLTGYTCNLKRLLVKVEDNIRKVDEKIQGQEIQGLDDVREAERWESLEQGKWLEARREWQAALGVRQPLDTRDYIQESVQKIKSAERAREEEALEKKVRPMYTEALSLYQARYYQISLDMFKEIDEVFANYKATDYYIDHISQIIEQGKQRRESDHQKFVKDLFR